MNPTRLLVTLSLATLLAATLAAQAPAAGPKGSFEQIKVHGKSLEGNLAGDSADRDVFVYLPPSYASNPQRRYPVVYFLHGYGVGADRYWSLLTMPDAADREVAGGLKEMIVVLPDAFTIYSGSMYSASPTTGDWEAFISEDLVGYVDSHYRTIASREARGLSGHSMGGYGTMRVGMKRPDVFGALYAMSSCCLLNDPRPPAALNDAKAGPNEAKGKAAPKQEAKGPAPTNAKGKDAAKGKGKGGGFANAPNAQAAAWASNPKNPPTYFDQPVKDGKLQPLIAAKYLANSPLVMVDQYFTNLKKYKAIALDCGLQDGLVTTNNQLDQALTQLGVPHSYETYEGDHGNRVKDRFAANVLPFFARNLTAAK